MEEGNSFVEYTGQPEETVKIEPEIRTEMLLEDLLLNLVRVGKNGGGFQKPVTVNGKTPRCLYDEENERYDLIGD